MRKTLGYIVTWQGRPMRDAAPTTLQPTERGRLFSLNAPAATVFPTYSSARTAMRRAVRAWGKVGSPITDDKAWSVVRLVTPWRPKA